MNVGCRGAFIVFEGIDRCGKTTQSLRLVDNLNNVLKNAIHMRFPNRLTETGKIIDSYLTLTTNVEDHVIHLIFSANRWETKDKIMSSLEAGNTVIADRYAYSGAVYTSAKGHDLNWCKNVDTGLPRPDLVIFLNLPTKEASKRGLFGEERYEHENFQEKVFMKYLELPEDNWRVLDALQDADVLEKQILELVLENLQEMCKKPISKLWMI